MLTRPIVVAVPARAKFSYDAVDISCGQIDCDYADVDGDNAGARLSLGLFGDFDDVVSQ